MIYVTETKADPPKMYHLLFTNPKSDEQYVFYKYDHDKIKWRGFIKIPGNDKIEIKEPKASRYIKTEIKEQKPLEPIEFKTDDFNKDVKFKTKLKNKYSVTNKYHENIRLIQSTKNNRFGVATKNNASLSENVLAEPIYKSVILNKLSQFTDITDFILVLEKSNGKKAILTNGKLLDMEFDNIKVFGFELRYSNNGLKGLAYRKSGKFIFFATKFSEIPNPITKYDNTGILKVSLPNNIWYYISKKKGLEFYSQ